MSLLLSLLLLIGTTAVLAALALYMAHCLETVQSGEPAWRGRR